MVFHLIERGVAGQDIHFDKVKVETELAGENNHLLAVAGTAVTERVKPMAAPRRRPSTAPLSGRPFRRRHRVLQAVDHFLRHHLPELAAFMGPVDQQTFGELRLRLGDMFGDQGF